MSDLDDRDAPLDTSPAEFRALGHQLVDRIADHLAGLRDRRVAPDEPFTTTRALLAGRPLPEDGEPADAVLARAFELVSTHATLTAHPRFWGYIVGSASPLGALGDMLAAAINPNVTSWTVGAAASAIEEQAVRWIAGFVGYPTDSGGLLVSGGTMANLVALAVARDARAGWDLRARGMTGASAVRVYASREVHPWLLRCLHLLGFPADAVHWIAVDDELRMDPEALRAAIAADRAAGHVPFVVVGTAGSVSTGAIDPLRALAEICREHRLWFHVDGAYGAFAACVDGAPADLRALALADSIAMDPHKWMYVPLEAGCVLLRDRGLLANAFRLDAGFFKGYAPIAGVDLPVPYRELGPQNSRGFRALKVWLCLQRAGRRGYAQMIGDDIRLAQHLRTRIAATPALELHASNLSITTFRYLPRDLATANAFNTELLRRLQASGEAYVSNATVAGTFLLRACIVNFRTRRADLDRLIDLVVALGRALEQEQA